MSTCYDGQMANNNNIDKDNNIDKFMTELKGWGIKTKKLINSGDFIMEYVGEVVSEKEFKLRMLTEYIEDTHHYCLHLDGGTGMII